MISEFKNGPSDFNEITINSFKIIICWLQSGKCGKVKHTHPPHTFWGSTPSFQLVSLCVVRKGESWRCGRIGRKYAILLSKEWLKIRDDNAKEFNECIFWERGVRSVRPLFFLWYEARCSVVIRVVNNMCYRSCADLKSCHTINFTIAPTSPNLKQARLKPRVWVILWPLTRNPTAEIWIPLRSINQGSHRL